LSEAGLVLLVLFVNRDFEEQEVEDMPLSPVIRGHALDLSKLKVPARDGRSDQRDYQSLCNLWTVNGFFQV